MSQESLKSDTAGEHRSRQQLKQGNRRREREKSAVKRNEHMTARGRTKSMTSYLGQLLAAGRGCDVIKSSGKFRGWWEE